MARQTTKRIVRLARNLRRSLSLPEVLLWQRFKRADVNIRKQHPCGRFVVDFYCPAANLIIEIDGIVHEMGDGPERDEVRMCWLQSQGYEVLRITAAEVLANVDQAADSIVAACRARGA